MATWDRITPWLVPPVMVPIILVALFWIVAGIQR